MERKYFMKHDTPQVKCYCFEEGKWGFKTIDLNDEYFLQYKKEWNQYKEFRSYWVYTD